MDPDFFVVFPQKASIRLPPYFDNTSTGSVNGSVTSSVNGSVTAQ